MDKIIQKAVGFRQKIKDAGGPKFIPMIFFLFASSTNFTYIYALIRRVLSLYKKIKS